MKKTFAQKGFSLTEVLIAMGIMSLAMIFIAALFPAGIHFTTISTERTIAAVAADEAFAKIRLYSDDPNIESPDVECSLLSPMALMWEFPYPSDPCIPINDKQYCWSAIWRRVPDIQDQDENTVQVTVFVSRRAGMNADYYLYYENTITTWLDSIPSIIKPWPTPVPVEVAFDRDNRIVITENVRCPLELSRRFFTEGCTIVDGKSGMIYRVLSRDNANENAVFLDKNWLGDAISDVWVVPPPVRGGRPPCIAVFQRVIRF